MCIRCAASGAKLEKYNHIAHFKRTLDFICLPLLSADGYKDEKVLLEEFDRVVRAFSESPAGHFCRAQRLVQLFFWQCCAVSVKLCCQPLTHFVVESLKPEYQKTIKEITRRMAEGMQKFTEQDVVKVADYDCKDPCHIKHTNKHAHTHARAHAQHTRTHSESESSFSHSFFFTLLLSLAALPDSLATATFKLCSSCSFLLRAHVLVCDLGCKRLSDEVSVEQTTCLSTHA